MDLARVGLDLVIQAGRIKWPDWTARFWFKYPDDLGTSQAPVILQSSTL